MDKKEGYNSKEWKHLRILKLDELPNCLFCLSIGYTVPATEVHHIIKWFDLWDDDRRRMLLLDKDNCICLCSKCHKDIHYRQAYITPLLTQYINDMKNYLCDKYYRDNIIIRWTEDINYKK